MATRRGSCRGSRKTETALPREAYLAADLRRRDQHDSNRQHSPLAMADDAILLDSTELDIDQVMARLHELLRHRHGAASPVSPAGTADPKNDGR